MHSIIIDTLVVRAPEGRVRILLGSYCLDFEAEDILGMEELGSPAGLVEGSAVSARVTVRTGARLLNIASAGLYSDLLWKRRTPFIFAARPVRPDEFDSEMIEKEAEFLRARGLDSKQIS